MAKIYVASKAVHYRRWLRLRSEGYPITSSWIDEAAPGGTRDWSDLWARCVTEASTADVLVFYRQTDDAHHKGSLLEVGAALSRQVPVYAFGAEDLSWSAHPLVRRFSFFCDLLIAVRNDFGVYIDPDKR